MCEDFLRFLTIFPENILFILIFIFLLSSLPVAPVRFFCICNKFLFFLLIYDSLSFTRAQLFTNCDNKCWHTPGLHDTSLEIKLHKATRYPHMYICFLTSEKKSGRLERKKHNVMLMCFTMHINTQQCSLYTLISGFKRANCEHMVSL